MRPIVGAARRESGGSSSTTARPTWRWSILTMPFFVGALVGALTLIALTRCL